MSVSDSEVLEVSGVYGGVSDVDHKEVVVWLQTCRLNSSYFGNFVLGSTSFVQSFGVMRLGKKVPKKQKNPTGVFSISICSTPNQNHPTPLRTDTSQVMGNTPVAVVI